MTPSDDGYDETRALWNGSFDKRPAVIARCRTTDDVIAVSSASPVRAASPSPFAAAATASPA